MKRMIIILLFSVFGLFVDLCYGETLELFTDTQSSGDSNWDFWQQDQDETVQEDAIYLTMYDGASGHSDDQPEAPADGIVDGVYSTLYMGVTGAPIYQSLGVSGTSSTEFPDDQRDTRLAALFNLTKLMALNSNPADINACKFQWSIDYVMSWAGSTTYLQAPTTLYVGLFIAEQQNYWNASSVLDGDGYPTTDVNDLQNEFDPNSFGILYEEIEVDLRVDDGPWGSGLQPLTNWFIEENGVQFYEVDFTDSLKDLIALDPDKYCDPNTAFVGVAIRPSRDGESVYLSLDATSRLSDDPIAPTLTIDVTTYPGDFNADGTVNLADFSVFAQSWSSTADDEQWNVKCDLDSGDSSENRIDMADLIVFCEHWFDGAADR